MSKTDPFRRGVSIFLGKTDSDLCPVAALLSYLAKRGLAPGPLFRFDEGHPLTRLALVSEVRAALTVAGIDPAPYSGHSFRIGAATSAAAAGVEDAVIKTLGRWRSDAYLRWLVRAIHYNFAILPLTTSIVLPLPSCFHFHRASTSTFTPPQDVSCKSRVSRAVIQLNASLDYPRRLCFSCFAGRENNEPFP